MRTGVHTCAHTGEHTHTRTCMHTQAVLRATLSSLRCDNGLPGTAHPVAFAAPVTRSWWGTPILLPPPHLHAHAHAHACLPATLGQGGRQLGLGLWDAHLPTACNMAAWSGSSSGGRDVWRSTAALPPPAVSLQAVVCLRVPGERRWHGCCAAKSTQGEGGRVTYCGGMHAQTLLATFSAYVQAQAQAQAQA